MDTQNTHPDHEAAAPGELALPVNVASGRPYQGGNILRLAAEAIDKGYRSPIWGGYGQLQAAGWQVRKGETSTEILAVIGRGPAASSEGGDGAASSTVTVASVPTRGDDGDAPRRGVRVVRVFNVEQCDRMSEADRAAAAERRAERAARAAERKAAGGKRKARKRKARD